MKIIQMPYIKAFQVTCDKQLHLPYTPIGDVKIMEVYDDGSHGDIFTVQPFGITKTTINIPKVKSEKVMVCCTINIKMPDEWWNMYSLS